MPTKNLRAILDNFKAQQASKKTALNVGSTKSLGSVLDDFEAKYPSKKIALNTAPGVVSKGEEDAHSTTHTDKDHNA